MGARGPNPDHGRIFETRRYHHWIQESRISLSIFNFSFIGEKSKLRPYGGPNPDHGRILKTRRYHHWIQEGRISLSIFNFSFIGHKIDKFWPSVDRFGWWRSPGPRGRKSKFWRRRRSWLIEFYMYSKFQLNRYGSSGDMERITQTDTHTDTDWVLLYKRPRWCSGAKTRTPTRTTWTTTKNPD
jgi:hypothetical protein